MKESSSSHFSKKELIGFIGAGVVLTGVIIAGSWATGEKSSGFPSAEPPPPPGLNIKEERPLTDQEARALGLPVTEEEWALWLGEGGDTIVVEPNIDVEEE